MDNYGADMIEKLKASGASPAAVQVQVEHLKKLKEQYEEPALQLTDDFLIEALPGWASHHGAFRRTVLRKKPQLP